MKLSKLINSNLKTVGYINAVLIIVAIVLRIVSLGGLPLHVLFDSVLCIIALIFGLFYSLNGYKKDAAKYYKMFMYLYFASSVLSFLAPLLKEKNVLFICINAIIVVLVFILAFIKDLGVNKSTCLSLMVLILNVIKLFFDVAEKVTIPSGFANFVLACVLCVFVSAKYADKASRGAK